MLELDRIQVCHGLATALWDVSLSLAAGELVCVVGPNVAGKTTLADTMIVATGRSNVHVGAIADHLAKAVRAAGYPTPRLEGLPNCDWVLLDAGDAIVHIFRPEVRQFYNLEKLWSADRPHEIQPARAG